MNDDPFAPFQDSEATIIRPSPGGFKPAAAAPPSPLQQDRSTGTSPPDKQTPGLDLLGQGAFFGNNPLVSCANSLLILAVRLRNVAEYNAIEPLYRELADRIRQYADRGLASGLDPRDVRIASYGLCAFIDEAVLATPWGSRSFWAHQSLLVKFHGDTWGGEKVFDFIAASLSQPLRQQPLIEFYWLLISLGFKGKFGVIDQGNQRLESLRTDLYASMELARTSRGLGLSENWQGISGTKKPLLREVPIWSFVAIAATTLLFAYLGFLFVLSRDSEPAARKAYALRNAQLQLPNPAPPQQPEKGLRAERFRRILASDIAVNRVEVIDDRLIRIRDSFASGSDRIKPEFIPMLNKIAEELARGGDHVLVTGHTDAQPIFSAKFPSNFDLSMSRANHVAQILRAFSKKEGLINSEGRADFEPLVIEDSPQSRAINRRVDIQIQ